MGHSKVPRSWCDIVLSLLLYSLSWIDTPPLKTGNTMSIYKCNKYPSRYFAVDPTPPKPRVKSFALPSITTTKVYTL